MQRSVRVISLLSSYIRYCDQIILWNQNLSSLFLIFITDIIIVYSLLYKKRKEKKNPYLYYFFNHAGLILPKAHTEYLRCYAQFPVDKRSGFKGILLG